VFLRDKKPVHRFRNHAANGKGGAAAVGRTPGATFAEIVVPGTRGVTVEKAPTRRVKVVFELPAGDRIVIHDRSEIGRAPIVARGVLLAHHIHALRAKGLAEVRLWRQVVGRAELAGELEAS